MDRLKFAGTAVVMIAVVAVVAYGPLSELRYSDDIPPGAGAVSPDGGIDATRLAPWYDGRLISPRELHELQKQGRAQTSVVSKGLACQGITPYFDTDAEQEAYVAANPVVTARPSPGCGTISPHPAFAETARR